MMSRAKFVEWIASNIEKEADAVATYKILGGEKNGVELARSFQKYSGAKALKEQFNEHMGDEQRHWGTLLQLYFDVTNTKYQSPQSTTKEGRSTRTPVIENDVKKSLIAIAFDEAAAIVDYMHGITEYWDLLAEKKAHASILGIVVDEMHHFSDTIKELSEKYFDLRTDSTTVYRGIELNKCEFSNSLKSKYSDWAKGEHLRKVHANSLIIHWISNRASLKDKSKIIDAIADGGILNQGTCYHAILGSDNANNCLFLINSNGGILPIEYDPWEQFIDVGHKYKINMEENAKSRVAFVFANANDSETIDLSNVHKHMSKLSHQGKDAFTPSIVSTSAKKIVLPFKNLTSYVMNILRTSESSITLKFPTPDEIFEVVI
jgi:rubrerythrin